MNNAIEKAAVEAAARTAQTDTVPEVTMREGQKLCAAASETGEKEGKEPVITEAAIVAPTAGVGAGDRLVEPKHAKFKHAKKASAARMAKVSASGKERNAMLFCRRASALDL